MPKIKSYSPPDPFERLSWLLYRKQTEKKVQTNEICRRVVQSYPTVRRKMDHPESMTLGDLQAFAKVLGISKAELVEVLPV